MDKFKKSKEFGNGFKEGEKINLLKPVTDHAYTLAFHIFGKAQKMLNAETFDEIYKVVDEDIYMYSLDMDTYRRLEEKGDIELMKERLLVHFYSYNLHKLYTTDVRTRGFNDDRIRRFFKAVTTEPISANDLADDYNLEYSTIKNHRRFDPYPERGITKIKNGKIYSQPVDG